MTEEAIARGRIRVSPKLAIIPAALLIALSVYAHFKVSSVSDDYVGSLAVFDRLFDLSFAIGFTILAFCVGRAISRRLSLEFYGAAEEISISTMLGFGLVALAVLALALAGLLKPIPVLTLTLGLAAISYREARSLFSVIVAVIRNVGSTKGNRTLGLLFMGFISVLVVRTLSPPHAFDEAIYHLSVTESFVEQGRLHPVYDNFPGNFPFLLHMLYAVCLMAKADIAAKLISLSLGVVTAFSLYAFCQRFINRRVGIVAMFGFFAAGMVIEVATTARIDVSLAGMLFVCAYSMMIYLETARLRWLLISAALAGVSIGIKYTAGIWLIFMGIMYLVESLATGRRPLLMVLRHGLLFSVLALLIASPWFIKNQVWFHNPVYPFLTGELADYRDGKLRYFDDNDERRLNEYFDTASSKYPQVVHSIESSLAAIASERLERHPFRFWEYFTKADTYNLGVPYQDPNYLFILAPLAFVFSRQRWLVWLGLFSVGFYIAIASTSWLSRFMLPIYPALTILAAVSLVKLGERLGPRVRLAGWLPHLAVGVVLSLLAFTSAARIYALQTVSFMTGTISRRDFMSGMFYYPPIDFINQTLEPAERVMMMAAQMSYDLKRPFIADAGWDSIEWQRLLIRNSSFDKVSEDLKRQGVTHILYSPSLFEFIALYGREGSGAAATLFQAKGQVEGGPPAELDYRVQLRNWATFEAYRLDYLEVVRAFRGYAVLRIK